MEILIEKASQTAAQVVRIEQSLKIVLIKNNHVTENRKWNRVLVVLYLSAVVGTVGYVFTQGCNHRER